MRNVGPTTFDVGMTRKLSPTRRVLGHGAGGIVFKTLDENLHRHVAINALSPQLAFTSPPCKTLLRKARSVAAPKHDNIGRIDTESHEELSPTPQSASRPPNLRQKKEAVGVADGFCKFTC